MIRIGTSHSIGYCENNSVILLSSPLLKIVSEIPDNVRIIPVPVAEGLTVLLATSSSVHQRSLCPAPLVERGEYALQSVGGSLLHDVIHVRPVCFIRSCEVVKSAAQRRCERIVTVDIPSVIRRAFSAVAECVTVTKQFNPQRVESSLSPICKVCSGVRVVQVGQNRMRRITDDEERRIARVEHVPSIRAWMERIHR